jgi:hypothetical protein
MNDPHVVSLSYDLLSTGDVKYQDPPALEFKGDLFTGCLEDDVVRLDPKHHYPSLELAKTAAGRFLQGWELDAQLRHGCQALAFQYLTGEIVDRDPPPPGASQTVSIGAASLVMAAGAVSICRGFSTYPAPPTHFRATAEVQDIWARLKGYQEGKEPLLTMAYYCLSVVEAMAPTRTDAARQVNVERAVLDTLGKLSSQRSDAATARKIDKKVGNSPLSEREKQWILAALPALLRSLGEAGTPASDRLSMLDLPSL